MKMQDMKMSKKDSKEAPGMTVSSPQRDKYPYGLRIRLESEQLEKLGIDGDVGDMVEVMATGKIINKSANETQGGKPERSMEIQIEKLACSYMKGDDKMSDQEYMDSAKKGKRR